MRATLTALFSILAVTGCAAAPPSAPEVPAAPTVVATAAVTTPVAPAAAPPPAAVPAPPMTPGSVAIGQVVGPPSFDPGPALEALKPTVLRCYGDARLINPQLHGRLVLEVHVNAAGAVNEVGAKPDTTGRSANDPGLVGCIADALKGATFPKPGGLATISVPLVFRQ